LLLFEKLIKSFNARRANANANANARARHPCRDKLTILAIQSLTSVCIAILSPCMRA